MSINGKKWPNGELSGLKQDAVKTDICQTEALDTAG